MTGDRADVGSKRADDRVEVVSVRSLPVVAGSDLPLHWVRIKHQLSEVELVVNSDEAGSWKPGDMVRIEAQHLWPDSNRICASVVKELLSFGSISDGDFEIPRPTYTAHEGVDQVRKAYLVAIFGMMIAEGELTNIGRGEWYFSAAPDAEPMGLFRLGVLVTEYRWKFAHEAAALSGYEQLSNRERGRRLAATERARQGKRSARTVCVIAKGILAEKPHLSGNMSALAREVHQHPNAPAKPDGGCLTVEAIRGHLNKLKESGKLGKSF